MKTKKLDARTLKRERDEAQNRLKNAEQKIERLERTNHRLRQAVGRKETQLRVLRQELEAQEIASMWEEG